MTETLPSLYWCRALLRNGQVQLNSEVWRVTNAYLIDPKKNQTKLGIALVVERRDGREPSLSASKLTEQFQEKYKQVPRALTWQGHPLDLQFFYPHDRALTSLKALELRLK
jgi:hypothetical protein